MRAVVLAAVMIEMGVVNERRDQKRNPAEQIPDEAERCELVSPNVDKLVNEQ